MAFSPDGKRLASASWDGTVKVWDAATGQETLTLKGHTGRMPQRGVQPRRQAARLRQRDETVKVWDAVTGQEIPTLKGHTGAVHSVAFSPDGKRLASASDDRTVKVWDAGTGQEIAPSGDIPTLSRRVAFSPDGKRIASASSDQTVKVWDVGTGQEILTLKGHDGAVSCAVQPRRQANRLRQLRPDSQGVGRRDRTRNFHSHADRQRFKMRHAQPR